MRKKITIVLPFFNEERNLPPLLTRLTQTTTNLPYDFDFLFVNDGSTDGSLDLLKNTATHQPAIKIVSLSRNFGHQTAVFAGLQHAQGDAVIIMDTDLQDRPEAIPDFITQWESGAEVVYAIRSKRKENVIKRVLFASFYRLLAGLSEIPIPVEAGLYSLMDRRVVDLLASMPERNRFVPGLRAWAGFRQVGIVVERDRRGDKKPRASILQLMRLAADAVFSFSHIPLRLATAIGLLSALVAFVATLVVLYNKYITHQAILGWTSTLLSIFFFGAVQLITIGIIGEYLGRIYEEVKRRPPYVVRGVWPDTAVPSPAHPISVSLSAPPPDRSNPAGSKTNDLEDSDDGMGSKFGKSAE